MIALVSHPEGTVLPVRAQPGARQNAIRGVKDGMLKVSVSQAPEKGKANKALIEVLSKELSLPKSSLVLLSGATSAQKRFLVRSVSRDELLERLRRFLADPSDHR